MSATDSPSVQPADAQMADGDIFDSVFACAPDNIAVFDVRGRILLANPSLLSYVGIGAEQIHNRTPDELSAVLNLSKLKGLVVEVSDTGKAAILEIPYDNDGAAAGIHLIHLVPDYGPNGNVRRVIGYGRDIANIDRLKASVAELQDQLHAAIRVLPDIFWIKDMHGRYVLCNDEFDRFNGVKRGALLGKTAAEVSTGPLLEKHLLTDQQALASTEPVIFRLEIPPVDGSESRFYDVQKVAIRNAKAEVTGMLGTARDITKKHLLAEALKARESEYRQLAENLPDCLVRYDAEGRPVYMNSALQKVLFSDLGLRPDELDQDLAAAFAKHPAFYKMYEGVLEALSHGGTSRAEIEFVTVRGDKIIHEIRHYPELGDDGKIVSVLGIGRDVTARKLAEKELEAKERELKRLAYSDGLTGLANRAAFDEALRDELDIARADGTKMALLLLDVDRFKAINDTLGHTAGDELLLVFAQRLKAIVGTSGWLGRLGGDEFAIILPGMTDEGAASAFASRILETLSRPLTLGGTVVAVSASIGMTIGPNDSNCEGTLFRYADLALYAAKAARRGSVRRYAAEMSHQADRRFEVEAMITEGLRLRQFETHFQAKIDLASGRIVGAEALCRWRHPERGLIAPNEFIPVAEETGQIVDIGRLVLRDACAFATERNRHSKDAFVVAVNVSARQLLFGGFLATLGLCLDEFACEARWLELEITESLLLADSNLVLDTLNALASLGILISVDDFGTGYSALSYLRRFPIGGLKIDQSFVRGIDVDAKQEVLVRAILAMAKGLGLRTVAEGVETDVCAAKLVAFGCDVGQGYLWHRPVSALEFVDSFLTSAGLHADPPHEADMKFMHC